MSKSKQRAEQPTLSGATIEQIGEELDRRYAGHVLVALGEDGSVHQSCAAKAGRGYALLGAVDRAKHCLLIRIYEATPAAREVRQ